MDPFTISHSPTSHLLASSPSLHCWAPHASRQHRLQGGQSPPLPRRPAPCSPQLPACISPSGQLLGLRSLGASRLPAWLVAQASPSARQLPVTHSAPWVPAPRPAQTHSSAPASAPLGATPRGGKGPRSGKRRDGPPHPLEMMAPPGVSGQGPSPWVSAPLSITQGRRPSCGAAIRMKCLAPAALSPTQLLPPP